MKIFRKSLQLHITRFLRGRSIPELSNDETKIYKTMVCALIEGDLKQIKKKHCYE